MLAQAVVEGGFEKMYERQEGEERNENPNADDDDDDDDERDEDEELRRAAHGVVVRLEGGDDGGLQLD